MDEIDISTEDDLHTVARLLPNKYLSAYKSIKACVVANITTMDLMRSSTSLVEVLGIIINEAVTEVSNSPMNQYKAQQIKLLFLII